MKTKRRFDSWLLAALFIVAVASSAVVEANYEVAPAQSASIAYDAIEEGQPAPDFDGYLMAPIQPNAYLPSSMTDTPWAYGGYWG